MCGRYTSSTNARDLAEYYGAAITGELPGPSWNVAPTDSVRGVLDRVPRGEEESGRQLRRLRWGLVPSWSKGPGTGPPMINARVETAAEKRAFRAAFQRRRAVIPADGYFEWVALREHGRTVKQPYYLHPVDVDQLALAGLYELWPDPSKSEAAEDRWLWSVTILTTDATGPAGEVV